MSVNKSFKLNENFKNRIFRFAEGIDIKVHKVSKQKLSFSKKVTKTNQQLKFSIFVSGLALTCAIIYSFPIALLLMLGLLFLAISFAVILPYVRSGRNFVEINRNEEFVCFNSGIRGNAIKWRFREISSFMVKFERLSTDGYRTYCGYVYINHSNGNNKLLFEVSSSNKSDVGGFVLLVSEYLKYISSSAEINTVYSKNW